LDQNTILHSGNDIVPTNAFGMEIWSPDSNFASDGNQGPSFIFVTNNEVGFSTGQGAHTWNDDHVLFQGNYIHHNGWTGIQIEKNTRFSILDGNRLEHNSFTGEKGSETGLWIDQSTDSVVRNNRSTGNNIGIWIGGGNNRVIARNNISYLNDGSKTRDFPEGLRVMGDPNKQPPTVPSSTNVMVVHNTLYKNGNTSIPSESFNLRLMDPTTANVARNNIVSDVVAGTNADAHPSYTVSNGCYWNPAVAIPSDSAAIRQDPQYVSAATGDFRLQAGSACIDKGAFLTTTTVAGSGTSVTVADGRYFSDGYTIAAGDTIMVGGTTAIITHVSGNTLTLDRSITWSAGAGVSYSYLGLAPDIGALESQ
jgi:hypothetical protein